MISPLLAARIGGLTVRLFASPLYAAHRQTDLPWHAVDDLYAALGLSQPRRAALLQAMRKSFGGAIRMVATPTGLVAIAPSRMAQDLIAWAAKRSVASAEVIARVRDDFNLAMGEATVQMLGHLDPVSQAFFMAAALDITLDKVAEVMVDSRKNA